MGRHLVRLLLALFGLAVLTIGALLSLGFLASISPLIALVAFVLLIVLAAYSLLVKRDWYEGLVGQGRDSLRELGSLAAIIVLVLGWALVGVLVAILFMIPAFLLTPEEPGHPAVTLGIVGFWAFFAILVMGPILTFRRLRHR